MKLFLKILGCIVLAFIFLIYLAYLFVLPRVVDLNSYKSMVQELVFKNTGMSLDFNNAKLITTPILETGIQISGLNLKLPDKTPLLETDGIRVKVSLPNLMLLTVRVSQVKIDNLKVTADTTLDGTQYKFMNVIQDLVNAEKEKKEEAPSNSFINPDNIRIKVMNISINNYNVAVNDLKAKHGIHLAGDQIKAMYYHRHKLKVKTAAKLYSDEDPVVNLNVDLCSIMPPPRKLDKEDDTNYRADIGFVNPVTIYRTYNIKTNIDAKLKLKKKVNGKLALNGYANIDDFTMNLSGYRIPESFIHTKFRGYKTFINTNLYVAPNQNIRAFGYFDSGRHPKMFADLDINEVYIKNIFALSKAFFDTLHIENNIVNLNTTGYITARTSIKTNFKKIRGNGAIIIRNGSITDNGVGIKDITANVIVNEDSLAISKTHMKLNNSPLSIDGSINNNGETDINVKGDHLPLSVLFTTFAPPKVKRAYNIGSGNLTVDAKINGTLKKAVSDIKITLSDLMFSAKDNSFAISDKLFETSLQSDKNVLDLRLKNNGLNVSLPKSKSNIYNPELSVIIDKNNVSVEPATLKINNSSSITVTGLVNGYNSKKFSTDFKANGSLYAEDLKQLMGKMAEPFVSAKGVLPLKAEIKGDKSRQDITLQIKADSNNYITPVNIEQLNGKTTICQVLLNYKINRLKFKDTGLYISNSEFTDDLTSNMLGAKPIVHTYGTIIKLDRPKPVINQIHIKIPQELNMNLSAFRNSHVDLSGDMMLFGQLAEPKTLGHIDIKNLSIPTLRTSMDNLKLGFLGNILNIDLTDLNLNGSDIQAKSSASLAPSSVFVINNLDINSRNIEVPKVMTVVDRFMKLLPPAEPSNTTADIPVEIRNGAIDMRRIVSPPLTLENTTGRFDLHNSILHLTNLNTSTLGGTVEGQVGVNLLNTMISANLKGEHFDVERALLEVMQMKDALSGMASFETDLRINGAAKNQTEQMKGISGTIDFNVVDGQFGPFGKLENLILAENIRESQFFQTALGGVINNLTQIQTSHFDVLNGHIVMDNGTAKLNPITSQGPVMCMHIAGDMDLIKNSADMKLRARLGSVIADMLGPLAAINPINLVKATPGLNVGAAKMFAFFCETLTSEEMKSIPNFEEKFGVMSTTNFQIVLRGGLDKPLSMIKSFKWLASSEQIAAAESFVETLPEADPENPNASLEEILAKQAEEERLANQNAIQKGARKIKEFFKKDNK